MNGEHRIIDGYRSEYLLANFKDGLYDGKYQEFRYNKLIVEGNYREGLKEGLFKEFYDNGQLKKETPMKAGKVDGIRKTYFNNGKIESEKGFKDGIEHGEDKYYDFETGECTRDCYYENGAYQGKQTIHITGSHEYIEVSHYDKGLAQGIYTQHYLNGSPRTLGEYQKGKKNGLWISFNEYGDTLRKEMYADNQLNGESVIFASNGKIEKVYHYKNDKKDGLCTDFDAMSGKPKREIYYKEGRQDGTEKLWVTSTNFDYIAVTTYVNNRKDGPYTAYYQEDKRRNIKEGTLKEKGQYKNGYKTAHWISYDTQGNIKREWDE